MKCSVLLRQAAFGLVALTATSVASASSYAFFATFTDFGTPADPAPDIFTISNISDPGITLDQIVIDLSGAANFPVFDTLDGASASYNYGAANGAPITAFSAPDVGYVDLTMAQQSALEEGQVLTLDFTDFDAGEAFAFTTDLDDVIDFFVSGSEMAGAIFTVTFTDANGNTFTDSGLFREALGTSANNDAFAVVKGTVAPIPVPGALLLMMSALGGLGAARFRKA
ncbi:MAG: VPLPA-CTERM sorting domain-containing protein [Pseudomonadota bacterium]